MATVTHAATATWSTTGGTTTNTHTPAVGDLLVVVAATSGLAGGTTAVTDNNADGNGTYTQVDVDRTGFSTTGVLTFWVRNALIGSATSTVVTAAQVGSSGGGLDVFRVSGMSLTGSAAVRQSSGQSSGASAATPAPVMGAACLTQNPVIGAVCCGTNATTNFTPRTGYTEASDVGYNTPATGLETMFRNSGETGTTLTWGSAAPSIFADIVVELDTTGVATATGSITLTGTANPQPIYPSSGSSDRVGRYGRSVPPVVVISRAPVLAGAAAGTGTITLTGTAAVKGVAAATGSITLTGSAALAAQLRPPVVVVAGEPGHALTRFRRAVRPAVLARNPQTMAAATATGTLTLTGTAGLAARAAATGSITLTGQAAALAVPSPPGVVVAGQAIRRTTRYHALYRAAVYRNPQTAGGAAATGTLTLTGAAALAARAAAAGTLTLTGTAVLRAPITPAGSLTLNCTAAAKAVAGATGSITLTGTATAVDTTAYPAGSADRLGRYGRSIPPVTRVIRSVAPQTTGALGSLTLTGTATVKAAAAAAGSITLNGTAATTAAAGPPRSVIVAGQAVQTAARYRVVNPALWTRTGAGVIGDLGVAAGTLTLTGTAAAKGVAAATGSITLTGSGAAALVTPRPGFLVAGQAIQTAPRYRALLRPQVLRPKPSAAVVAGATGSLTLTGSAAARAPVTAAGSITLNGQATAHPPGPQPNGHLTLTGTGAVKTTTAATGHLILLGVATTRAHLTAGTARGTLTLTGAAAARVTVGIATGHITLLGAVFLIRRDLSLVGVLEGARFTSTLESGRHLTGKVEGPRYSSELEGT
jgi:hypothetical protein